MHHKVKKRLSIYIWSCLVITLGFAATALLNWYSVSKIVNDDLEKSTRLMTAGLYSSIQNEMGKPTVVANTMASDTYLVQWLREERNGNESYTHREELRNYLTLLKRKNGFSSAYLISAHTLDYHCAHRGLCKRLSANNVDDWWYYRFLSSGKDYDLEINKDEQNKNILSVFINARIENEDHEFMGVTGVALPVELFQNLLGQYEDEYDIQACLVSSDNKVQVKPGEDSDQKENIFEKWNIREEDESILKGREENNIRTYYTGGKEYCIVSVYIKELDWYLYIKEVSNGYVLLSRLTNQNFFIMGGVLLVLLVVNLWVLYLDNKRKEKHMSVDTLTGIYTRNYFFDMIVPRGQQSFGKEQYIIMFDIDCFKHINDTRGHNVGDQMLKLVAEKMKRRFAPYGELVRWGGDEFIALVTTDKKQIQQIFKEAQKEIAEEGITISMGVVRYEKNLDILQVIDRADQAMYQQKRNGKDGLTFYEK